jgi:hypothetical protein
MRQREIVRNAVVSLFAVVFGASLLLGAVDEDFYGSALRRGVTNFEAGNYEAALPELRIAAFGTIDDVARFETAEAYIAVAARRLKRDDEAKGALQRILAAERIEKHFASLQITLALRTAVNDAAKALLPPERAAMLEAPPEQTQIAASSEPAPPRTETIVVPDPLAPDTAALLADAERALAAGNVTLARSKYIAALDAPRLPHAALLKIGEGMYRVHDFAGSVRAFERAGAFAKGEEPYRYYFAVALYESRRYRDAKRELAAALPFIAATPDVEKYRAKIERAK